MRIERRYTKDGQSAYANMTFRHVTSEIRNPDGSVVFKLDNVEVPDSWSQVERGTSMTGISCFDDWPHDSAMILRSRKRLLFETIF